MPSSSKINRGIVLATVSGDHAGIDFYSFDQSSYPLRPRAERYRRSKFIKVTPRLFNTNSLGTLTHNHVYAGYAYCSSTGHVYRAGGMTNHCDRCSFSHQPFTNQVHYWSLSDRHTYTLPRMNVRRGQPRLLTLRGTLFAIGGKFCGHGYETAFIEFYEQGNGRWMQIENPSNLVDMEPLLSCQFVCGAVDAGFDRYTIMIGSYAKESFLGLDLHFTSDGKDGKIKWKWNWRVTEVPFDKRLCSCYGSPPAIVSNSKKRMMWLDCVIRSKLYVLYYVRKRYCVIDLVHLGALPSRRRSGEYYAKLVDLKSDGDDHFGLIWQDKNIYIPTTDSCTYEVISDTEEGFRALSLGAGKLTGHNLTIFEVLDDNQADDDIVFLESRQLCIAPGIGFTVVGVFTMDLGMSLSLSNLFSRLLGRKEEIRILIAGLCTAGKVTILRKLGLEIEVSSYGQRPILLSSNYKNISFTVTDRLTDVLVRWFCPTLPHGIIFVVDSSNRDKIRSARKFLHRVFEEIPTSGDAAVLIFSNKQDLPKAMNAYKIRKRLHLNSLSRYKKCNWHIQSCCATSGEGLYQGLTWLSNSITTKAKDNTMDL